ncbi:HD domain-containing phosphohydrolase [Parasulfuritortus cantonensis]|nr:HD domain-containing phosphohydrolase [Parasulfuritortus cantonensis]
MDRLRQLSPGRPAAMFLKALLLAAFALPALAADVVNIGVLAMRGPDKALSMWSATAAYLGQALPDQRFRIVPLGFDDVRLAVRQGRVDFVLSNSSYYVELESHYGVSAVATLKNRFDGGPGFSQFGGVIFTRADRGDIRAVGDLRSRVVAAVDASSFGGWLAGWREMKRLGVDPERDLRRLYFAHTHDAVVYAVRDGHADAGIVRTDTLERMAAEGRIKLSDYFVLNRQPAAEFPLLLSTALYPEWPLAKLRQVPDDLAVRVAIALMQMPADAPAARAAQITGWTLPLNYQPVHDALKELRIGPYEHLRRLTAAEVLAQYGQWLALAAMLSLAILATVVYVGRINRRLRQNQQQLEELNAGLETRVGERTAEVASLLEREHFLRGVVEMVADVNQILITAGSMEEMLKACCDRLVAHGDYRFAWVGLAVDGRQEVAARSYGAAEFIRSVALAGDHGPAVDAVAGNRTVVEADLAERAPDLAKAGGRGLIALPLREDAFSAPLGVLGVLTARQRGFDAEEVAMLEQLAGDIGFAIHAFGQRKETRRLQQERIHNYEETILSLVDMIEKRDTYTAGHTRRVAYYCEMIATRMGRSPEEIEKLKRAAILHDIGKIAIPDAVLLKPGKLTALEYDLIKQHAEEGYRTLTGIEMYRELAEIMRYHHERLDGSGYPHGLTDGQIPLLARIMAVADAFDAMTTNRIYKPRKEVPVALDELRQMAGEQFDAEVVEAACAVLGEVQPPSVSDQLPKTALERQRFAYFFDDQLTGVHNASYLQLMLRNGLPTRYGHAYAVLLRDFADLNDSAGWAAGNSALAGFAATLTEAYPEAVVFRVMGDDFVLLAGRPLDLDGTRLKAASPLAGTPVEVEVRQLDPHGSDREYLQELL